jgi:hypothetical protein
MRWQTAYPIASAFPSKPAGVPKSHPTSSNPTANRTGFSHEIRFRLFLKDSRSIFLIIGVFYKNASDNINEEEGASTQQTFPIGIENLPIFSLKFGKAFHLRYHTIRIYPMNGEEKEDEKNLGPAGTPVHAAGSLLAPHQPCASREPDCCTKYPGGHPHGHGCPPHIHPAAANSYY